MLIGSSQPKPFKLCVGNWRRGEEGEDAICKSETLKIFWFTNIKRKSFPCQCTIEEAWLWLLIPKWGNPVAGFYILKIFYSFQEKLELCITISVRVRNVISKYSMKSICNTNNGGCN